MAPAAGKIFSPPQLGPSSNSEQKTRGRVRVHVSSSGIRKSSDGASSAVEVKESVVKHGTVFVTVSFKKK
ncbi:hypothetical protein [Paraburkholderia aspalathi]|uniref:hypothetical protein n=1 Tax=Paraburkholderia aspalathi TaxID=1324617 RepID=UPI003CA07DEA